MSENIFELLAPAGSLETFKAVINAGADAVYVGGNMFGARAYANNFSEEELVYAIKYAHLRGRKVFLTVNTLLKNNEINNNLVDYIRPYYEAGLDAVLVQDFGTLSFLHKIFPDLPLHTSTQMTITSAYGAKFLQKYGVTRVVMAREISLQEMKKIHEETGIEIEAFVHGALCYSYSGQCLFSSIIGGRSGNRGRCAQPCRLPYQVLDEKKQKITDTTYILSLKDMCGINDLKELHNAGVYSLKIEGRMKQTSYAAGVVSYYRKYIDKYCNDYNKVNLSNKDNNVINALGNRCGFTNKYYYNHNSSDMVTYVKPSYTTSNEQMHEDILNKYLSENKITIDGYANFKLNEKASLTLVYKDISITVYGNIVDCAKKSPVSREQIINRLSKTGDTDFKFENIFVECDENIFVPNGELNKIRRDAIELLQNEILKETYRIYDNDIIFDNNSCNINALNETELAVSIEDRMLLDTLLDYGFIDDIYIDYDSYSKENILDDIKMDCAKIHSAKKSAFIILPSIFRNQTVSFFEDKHLIEALKNYDGFIIKNYEEIEYVNTYFGDSILITDHNMYTYNNISKNEFINNNITYDTIPLELNAKEIANRNNINSEIIVYGYYPLMTSAGCVNKNSNKCDKCKKTLYLKDRYNKLFPVKNKCNECYNVIYNSLPTLLFSNIKALSSNNIKRFRISFTIETEKEVKKILELYNSFSINNVDIEYTNGHYKRGVE